MQLLFIKKIEDKNSLELYINQNNLSLPNYRMAVIALITDKDGRILLQRRGPKSRDENFKLEDIGGAVEDVDKNFIAALYREIKEEVGDEAKFSVDKFVGGFLNTKYDYRINEEINWLFMVYKVTYESGKLYINEPGKCLGYEFYEYDDLPLSEVTESSLYYWNYYFNK